MKYASKIVLVCLLISFIHLTAISQAIMPIWAFQAGGKGLDRAVKVINEADGDIYFAGIIEKEANLSSGSNDTIFCLAEDILLGKINPYGQLLWFKHIYGQGDDCPTDLAVDNGYIFLSGNFQDTLFFETDTIVAQDYTDSFVAKIDSSGNIIWVRQFSGCGNQQCTCLIIDLEGNLLTGGLFSKTINFPETPAGNFITEANYSGFLCKWNDQGVMLWKKQINGTRSCTVEDVIVDNFNDYYITGNYSDTLFFNDNQDTMTSSGENDIFLFKYSKDGIECWDKTIGSVHDDKAKGLTLGGNGKISVIGEFKEGLYYTEEILCAGAGGDDVFYLTFNKNGNLIKSKKHGLEKNDFVFDAYIPIGQKILMASDIKTQPGSRNVSLATYELLGELSEVIQTGTDYNPLILSSIMPEENEIVFCGSFHGNVSFDQLDLTARGDEDFFIIKMGQALIELESMPADTNLMQGLVFNGADIKSEEDQILSSDSIGALSNQQILFNYPNPFSQKTQIIYSLPETSSVCLKILTMNGTCIKRWEYTTQSTGIHFVEYNNFGYPSGLYYCQLSAKGAETDILKTIKIIRIPK